MTPTRPSTKQLTDIRRRVTPVVLLDRFARSAHFGGVGVHDELGGALAVQHLLDKSHRRIAFVGGPVSLPQVRDRVAGARRIVEEAGGADYQRSEKLAPSVAVGAEAVARISELASGRRPTAVFCANDLLALGVLQELTRRRIAVPEDVAIVGYDDHRHVVFTPELVVRASSELHRSGPRKSARASSLGMAG